MKDLNDEERAFFERHTYVGRYRNNHDYAVLFDRDNPALQGITSPMRGLTIGVMDKDGPQFYRYLRDTGIMWHKYTRRESEILALAAFPHMRDDGRTDDR